MAHSKSEIKKAKNLLNKFAPTGEQLAFINSKEATLLKRIGGAGKDINGTGIKSYYGSDDYGSGEDGKGSSGPSGGGSGGDSDNSPQRASFRSVAPKTAAPRSILSRVAKAVGNFIKGGGTVGFLGRKIGEAYKVNKEQNRRDKLTSQFASEAGRIGFTNNNISGGDNYTPPARNVGGRIIKLSPTTAEVSQSSATDVTYDSRKTKARGRSMTIRTNSRGVGNNMASVLGTKSLLGAA